MLQEQRGNVMEISHEHHGNAMEILWSCCGSTLGNPIANTLGMLWERHGNRYGEAMRMSNDATGILREYYENAMLVLRVYLKVGKYYRSVANAMEGETMIMPKSTMGTLWECCDNGMVILWEYCGTGIGIM